VSVFEFSTKHTFSNECGVASRPRTCKPFCDASTAQSPSGLTAQSDASNSRRAASFDMASKPPAIAPAAAPAAFAASFSLDAAVHVALEGRRLETSILLHRFKG
jgi:hypothetical protein